LEKHKPLCFLFWPNARTRRRRRTLNEELKKIMANLDDLNFEAKAKRAITIEIEFKTDKSRQAVTVAAKFKTKLAAPKQSLSELNGIEFWSVFGVMSRARFRMMTFKEQASGLRRTSATHLLRNKTRQQVFDDVNGIAQRYVQHWTDWLAAEPVLVCSCLARFWENGRQRGLMPCDVCAPKQSSAIHFSTTCSTSRQPGPALSVT
jgi:hypothetical protein